MHFDPAQALRLARETLDIEAAAVVGLKARLGDACRSYTIDKGLAGGAPGSPATYVAMCHIFVDSVEAFQKGFGAHAAEIMGDIPNYTDIQPVVQISEVVVG